MPCELKDKSAQGDFPPVRESNSPKHLADVSADIFLSVCRGCLVLDEFQPLVTIVPEAGVA